MTLCSEDWVYVPADGKVPVTVRLPALEEIVLQWPRISEMIGRATVRQGCFEPIDYLQLAMAGRVGIWVCEVDHRIDAVMITEVRTYPRRRVLEVVACGGDRMTRWHRAASEALNRHGRENGCSHISATGRPGWARVTGSEFVGDVAMTRPIPQDDDHG